MAALYALFAFVAGCVLPVQAGVNARLAEWVGGPVRAALVSFVVGLLALFALVLLFYRTRSTGSLGEAPWWLWMGGLLGAVYVVAAAVTAPRLGAATLVVLVVAGQAVMGLVVDHFGWVGFPEEPVSAGRIAWVVLLGVGVGLVPFT